MSQYKIFKLTYQQVLDGPYIDTVVTIYNAIPSHHVVDLLDDDIMDLLGYYPALYATLSQHYSLLLGSYSRGKYNKLFNLKQAYEQALKVVKFEYESLSRKITVVKGEKDIWGGVNK